jgi:hypothetical protein
MAVITWSYYKDVILIFRRFSMKQFAYDFSLLVQRRNIRVAVLLVTIVLYIIGAGAPDAAGGVGM